MVKLGNVVFQFIKSRSMLKTVESSKYLRENDKPTIRAPTDAAIIDNNQIQLKIKCLFQFYLKKIFFINTTYTSNGCRFLAIKCCPPWTLVCSKIPRKYLHKNFTPE